MARKYLSKSTFIKGVQCEKALYLHKFYPELADEITEQQKAIFQTGTNVGILAQELFPGGVDAGPKDYKEYFKSFKYTQQLIEDGVEVIYEAGFCHNYVMCFVDILVKTEDGWHAYEVKSSTKISATYYTDASLQYYIMKASGLNITDVSITHINNKYLRDGKLDLNQLFLSTSVLKQAKENHHYVKNKLEDLHQVLSQDSIPKVDIGIHCTNPYDCNFKGECWKHIPEYSIFNISRLKAETKWNLYNGRCIDIKDIPADTELSSKQKIEIQAYLQGNEIIHKKEIRDFVANLSDKLYHLDFETYQSAIPEFDGVKAFQQIPFQYSAHYQENGSVHHFEFLADPSKDSREPFIQTLIRDMQNEGDILVYNIAFERGRLNELITAFPQYTNQLQAIIERMKDLMIPFKNKWYYTPSMKGSYSIKSVLPALAPSFSYDNLEINNGSLASSSYVFLRTLKEPEEVKKIKENLLAYCKMDTLAMVKILEVLKQL